MWEYVLENSWPFLVMIAVIALVGWLNHRHNCTAARKGQNPRSFNLPFGRNSFRKEPEQPYTEDRRINRHWKP